MEALTVSKQDWGVANEIFLGYWQVGEGEVDA